MRKLLLYLGATILLSTTSTAAELQQTDRAQLDKIEQSLKNDVPRILCLDNDFATGAQPTDQAYAKAAATGFRSVLSLRAGNEGIDLFRERSVVERSKMKYFNIPVVSSAPRPERVDEFIWLVKEPSNHPMLINSPAPIASAHSC